MKTSKICLQNLGPSLLTFFFLLIWIGGILIEMFYRNSGPDFLEDEELKYRYKFKHASLFCVFFPTAWLDLGMGLSGLMKWNLKYIWIRQWYCLTWRVCPHLGLLVCRSLEEDFYRSMKSKFSVEQWVTAAREQKILLPVCWEQVPEYQV